ncbi:proline racemase [Penicillium hispanicum]|uniref:proline racemase n=1 Tax=Penicillium hispanicum TaxID=1080232 RepID=UPI002541BFE8|nr:proline racemase [Penicillium hispanicum]KAJ5570257.1 proline racemase [Penicillium hispanicum]
MATRVLRKKPNRDLGSYSSSVPKEFDNVIVLGAVSVVGTHAEGEACDVVIGGVRDVSGQTISERQRRFQDEQGGLCARLLNEPRGRCGMNAVFMLKPSSSAADRALLMAKNNEFVPISISSVISAANVLAELPQAGGPDPDQASLVNKYTFETVAGNILVEANYRADNDKGYLCDTVNVHNVPSYVVTLRHRVDIPSVGTVSMDIAFGGVFCAFVDAASIGLKLDYGHGEKIVRIGEQIKRSLRSFTATHPEKPEISGISSVVFTGKVERRSQVKVVRSATVVSPGRLDRSPSGTATSALLAVMRARGEIKTETLCNRSLSNTEYFGRIDGKAQVGPYRAIKPVIKGRAFITSLKHVVRDPNDPFQEGFRGADQWGPEETKNDQQDMSGLGLAFEATSLEDRDYENFDWDDRASTVFTIYSPEIH